MVDGTCTVAAGGNANVGGDEDEDAFRLSR